MPKHAIIEKYCDKIIIIFIYANPYIRDCNSIAYWNDFVKIVISFIPRVGHLNSRPTVIHEALDRHRVHPGWSI
jgi:hypothetical protein